VKAIFVSILLFSTTVFSALEDHYSHLPTGGRRALHGMVLFGSGPYFLEHIPMLTPPHDFQIIVLVKLTDVGGRKITQSFSREGFTLQPSATFSLNDYVAGRLKKFTGSIHNGSFEKNGPVVTGMESVMVEVMEYRVIRQLPSTSTGSADQWIKLSDGTHVFESNLIRPQRNIQQIRNTTLKLNLWCVTAPDFFEPCR
jgi:hypothetical protein